MNINDSFAKKVTVLGREYSINVYTAEEDKYFKEHSDTYGYCDYIDHKIALLDASTKDAYKSETEDYILKAMKETLRHEIIHAFLDESGLCSSSLALGSIPWALNEEMVDWFAIQGPKILEAWKKAKAL